MAGRGKSGYQMVNTATPEPPDPPHANGIVKSEDSVMLRVERPAWKQQDFDSHLLYSKPHEPGCRELLWQKSQKLRQCSVKKVVTTLFPVVSWLPKYKFKEELVSDIIAGFTVAVMHIPQGMAYALLAGVPPIVGIYMAFFPVLIYFLMGTSRHISMGTFAVISIMTGKIIGMYAGTEIDTWDDGNSTDTPENNPLSSEDTVRIWEDGPTVLEPLQIGTAVCFMVGIWQLLMGMLRMGALSRVLSDTLVSGFTTGAAIHVFTSQVKNLVGVKVPRFNGPFKIVFTYVSIFQNIHRTNVLALGMSMATIILLVINNEYIKPLLSKKIRFPLPAEFLVVVAGTLISQYAQLEHQFNLAVVGAIPTGLPLPTAPPMWFLPTIMVDSFVIAVVSYSVTYSMARIFAQKYNYEVDANQELVAGGVGNVVGSFFSCIPYSVSLSRSLIQASVGGKTQIASVVSCLLLVFVLLWVGPFFEPLPDCILAGIIVVALKGMFVQLADAKVAWQKSSVDGMIWVITFLSVVLLDIDYGLGLGVAVSLLSILYLSQRPDFFRLGVVPNTDIYLDVNRYGAVVEWPGLCILRFCGGLHFANRDSFKEELYRLTKMNPRKLLLMKQKAKKKADKDALSDAIPISINDSPARSTPEPDEKSNSKASNTLLDIAAAFSQVHTIILDMSAVSFVDPSGVKTLKMAAQEYQSLGISFHLAACSAGVTESLRRCSFASEVSSGQMFPTVHDAVIIGQSLSQSELSSDT